MLTKTSLPFMIKVQMTIQAYRRQFQARLQKSFERREARRLQVLRTAMAAFPSAIATFPSVRRAYLFGSVTRAGAFGVESDIDVAVEGTTAEDYFALWAELEGILPEVIIDVREITPDSLFGQRVHKTGILLYERRDPPPTS